MSFILCYMNIYRKDNIPGEKYQLEDTDFLATDLSCTTFKSSNCELLHKSISLPHKFYTNQITQPLLVMIYIYICAYLYVWTVEDI